MFDFGLWMLCRTFLSWSVGISRPEGIVRGQSFEEINPCFGLSQSLYVKQHRQFVAHGLCTWVVFPFPPFLATNAKTRCKPEVLQKSAHRKKIVLTKPGQTLEGPGKLLASPAQLTTVKYTQQKCTFKLFFSADPCVELPCRSWCHSGRKSLCSRLGFSRGSGILVLQRWTAGQGHVGCEGEDGVESIRIFCGWLWCYRKYSWKCILSISCNLLEHSLGHANRLKTWQSLYIIIIYL